MIQKTKNRLYYAIALIFFFSIVLLANNLIITEAQGSSSGSVIATVSVNPITLDVRNNPRSPFVDKTFSLRATVKNTSSDVLNNVEATIFVPSGLTLISGQTQWLGTLDGNRKKRATWDVHADIAGNRVVTVVVTATDSSNSTPVSSEESIIIEVRNKPGNGLGALLAFINNLFK